MYYRIECRIAKLESETMIEIKAGHDGACSQSQHMGGWGQPGLHAEILYQKTKPKSKPIKKKQNKTTTKKPTTQKETSCHGWGFLDPALLIPLKNPLVGLALGTLKWSSLRSSIGEIICSALQFRKIILTANGGEC
jgi:hypothetical protein